MLKENSVLIGLAVAGAATALLGIAVFDWMSWTCRLPTGEAGKPFDLGPGGCFEFWLNRYQTIIGAIVAIGAALYAGKLVRAQIITAEKQAKLTRIQLAFDSFERLQERIVDASGIVSAHDNLTRVVDECEKQLITIEDLMREVLALSLKEKLDLYAKGQYNVIDNAYRFKDDIVKKRQQKEEIINSITFSKYPTPLIKEFELYAEFVGQYIERSSNFFDALIRDRDVQLPSTLTFEAVQKANIIRPGRSFIFETHSMHTIKKYKNSAQKLYDLTIIEAERLSEIQD